MLLEALYEQNILSPGQLVSLLGEKRHVVTLNRLEIALCREAIMNKDDLLTLKGELSGMPIYTDHTIAVTAHLDPVIAARVGALVLARTPLTVTMVEDTVENVEQVAAAIGTSDFDIWLTTAPQFAELRRVAYDDVARDIRPRAADVFAVMDAGLKARASDLHLKVGIPPRLRVDGSMVDMDFQPLDQLWMRAQIDALAERRHLDDLDRKYSTDLAYTFGTTRFRINVATDANGNTMTLRRLPSEIPTPDDIGLPEVIRQFATLERGLVLVTGPTGSGKSTTLAAILSEIITKQRRHVITLEDPIEFRFPTDRGSLVNQRELGSSLNSFPDGIRDALRQDPDVILVGELRDSITTAAALLASETGHLCLATMHTTSAASTVARMVGSFPTEEQNSVRAQLSQMLRGVVSQTLLPRLSTKGRVASYEILLNTPAVSTNLRKVDGAGAVRQTMQTSSSTGMTTMEMYLAGLVHQGIVSKKEALFRAQDPAEFDQALEFLQSQ
jgi:twitching motility protein PilT